MTKRTLLNFFPVAIALAFPVLLSVSCGGPADKAATDTDSSTLKDKDGFVKIFDGKSFAGWEGDTSVWKVEDGDFIGVVDSTKKLQHNTFLIYRAAQPADFEFKAEYRISDKGNSGIQYRSEEVKDLPLALKGYQADIDGENQYTGQNYEERGRGFLAMRGQKVTLEPNVKPIITDSVGNSDSLKTHIKNSSDWNEVYIVAKGNRLKHYINGILMSDVTDNDTTARKSTGWIGLQAHVLPYMKVEYRNIRLKQE